jgi:hypothetical protein
LAALLAFLLFAASMPAQVSNVGSVQGTVTDASGGMIAEAMLVLQNVETGNRLSAKTESSGEYTFLIVPVGRYELTVTKQGFKKQVHSEFEVHAAEHLRINEVLSVGSVAEEVVVTAAPPVVNTVTASEGNTVTGDQINALPLTNRVFTQLVGLEPGVQAPIQEDPGFGSNSSVAFSVNGVRDDENNLLIDGIRNVDTFGGNAFVTPNLFAISEFRVESSDYSAKAGRSAGGQVNLISRAGTNQFHGNAFEFFRNDVMNAMDALSTLKPENRWNDFGYDVGGPIKKDRLFFFWSEEWRRIIQASGPNITYTPTAAERSGDFRGRLTGQMVSPCPNPEGTDPEFDSGTVFDPLTAVNYTCGDGTVVTVKTPFSYNGLLNVIPPNRIDKNASLLLNTYFPLPTPGYKYPGGGNFNYISQEPNFTKWREESIRVDYKLSDKWSLFGRYSQDSVNLWNPYGLWGENPFPDVGGSNQNFPIYNATVHLMYVPKTNFITEFTWGIYYANDKSLRNSPLSNRDRAPGLDLQYAFPYNTNASEGNRIPTIYLNGGYTGIVEQWWFHNYAFSMPFTSDNTWTTGNHIVRFGLTFLPEGKSELANPSSNNTNGTFTFTGDSTNNALADMLLGNAYNYTEVALDPFGNYRWFNLEPYIEDQIKVRPNLTLTLGLRYEYFQPEHEKKNQFATFNAATFDPSKAPVVNWDGTIDPTTIVDPLNGIVIGGKTSPYGNALFPSHKDAFAPRIGIVWDPTGAGKTAIRSGYGIFYDRWGSYSQFGINNPPFNQSVNIYDTSLDAPAGVSGAVYPSSLNAAQAPWKYPNVQKWSLSVQHEILRDTSLSAAYVGTKGTHLLGDYNMNQPAPNPEIADWSISPDSVRPYLGFSNITAYATRFSSTYNALQVELLHRLQNGLSFQASYTYSKTLTDESSTGSWPQNSYDFKAERGIADFDMTHMLNLNYSWDLPFFRHASGFKKAALHGWQISGITKFQSGAPINITLFADQAGIGSWNERPNIIANPFQAGPIMANSNPGCHVLVSQGGLAPDHIHTMAAWFNPCAFDLQAVGAFGDSPRNPIRGPAAQVWDMGLMKAFPIHESWNLQFRAQAFNVFNHPGRTSVDSYYDDPSFGVINGTLTPRIMELSLVLNF